MKCNQNIIKELEAILNQYESSIENIISDEIIDMYVKEKKTKANI
ncbi:hypothetical protein [Clostridium botulinum]|nr:hypothetical protein [Clostridium botulinum]